jgi:hypothetical protein
VLSYFGLPQQGPEFGGSTSSARSESDSLRGSYLEPAESEAASESTTGNTIHVWVAPAQVDNNEMNLNCLTQRAWSPAKSSSLVIPNHPSTILVGSLRCRHCRGTGRWITVNVLSSQITARGQAGRIPAAVLSSLVCRRPKPVLRPAWPSPPSTNAGTAGLSLALGKP